MARHSDVIGADASDRLRARLRTSIRPRVTLDRSKLYIFLVRGRYRDRIGVRGWDGHRWRTRRLRGYSLAGPGPWRVMRSPLPFWRRGPRMVLEVAA